MKKFGLPSPAMVVATVALILGLTGAAFGALQVVGKGDIKSKFLANKSVKSSKIASKAVKKSKLGDAAVTTEKIANQGITGEKFFLSSVTTLNFGDVAGETCTRQTIPAQGVTANDHILVTPPPGWPDTFNGTASAEPANNLVVFTACNTFTGGGAVDPDGAGGGPYKLLVIR